MNYQETLQWLFKQLPMYQRVGNKAYKVDLTNILSLAHHLDNPQEQFKTIHVAGTNGKGSTSHMLASILQEAGYKVGLYTSPHLLDFRERIKINGIVVSQNFVVDFVKRNKLYMETEGLSFFEMTVGMAFSAFAKAGVTIAIIETGLGGRLDSTNIIKPLVSVITNVSMDHQTILGNTIPEIATEKAGIIKPETPVVLGEMKQEAKEILLEVAKNNKAQVYQVTTQTTLQSDLQGDYQLQNMNTAVETIAVLQKKGFEITPRHIEKGLLHVVSNTGLRGRWEKIQDNPLVLCDTGHNLAGLKTLIPQVTAQDYEQLHMVIGMVNDKDVESIIKLFPKGAQYYFCKANVPRAMDAIVLGYKFAQGGISGLVFDKVSQAIEAAFVAANQEDMIFIGGSTFTVADALEYFSKKSL